MKWRGRSGERRWSGGDVVAHSQVGDRSDRPERLKRLDEVLNEFHRVNK